MSTRNAIAIISVALVVALILLVTSRKGKEPQGGSTEPVAKRPTVKPERADSELFERYKGMAVADILEALPPVEVGQEQTASVVFVQSLPDAPFPYSVGEKPVNENTLRQFVQDIETGKLGQPTMVDLWRYNIANAALGKEPKTISAEFLLKTQPVMETENFPVTFTPRTTELSGPVLVGNFDSSSDEMEVITHGGTKMWGFNTEGDLAPMENELGSGKAGDALRSVDYDNDGDLDLFVIRRGGLPNTLLRNDGNGAFTDVTDASGLLNFSDTADAEWFDYDCDGLIDLAVGCYDHPFEIYRQVSVGSFKPVSWDLDLWYPQGVENIEIIDINGDHYPDMFLTIADHGGHLLFAIPSSDSERWGFLNKTVESGLPIQGGDVCFKMFDFDNDGDFDLLMGKSSNKASEEVIAVALNGNSQPKINDLRLFRNDGEGTFSEYTDLTGLEGVQDVHGLHVLDIDGDCFEDIIAVTGDLSFNRTFWNRSGVEFRDISEGCGLSYLDSPEQLFSLDCDNDGTLDLFLTDGNGNVKWLEGNGVVDNWLALKFSNSIPGTKVRLVTRDGDWVLQPIYRIAGASQHMTIGIGQADKIESIDIFPPHATEPLQLMSKVQPNQQVQLEIPATTSPGEIAKQ